MMINRIDSKNNSDNEFAEIHHATFPVEFAAKVVEAYSEKSVLDLFGGTGTTMIAAEQLGRKCYMMELDPHYCDVIIARWEKLTGQKAERISDG
jgi:DNA modification methylase